MKIKDAALAIKNTVLFSSKIKEYLLQNLSSYSETQIGAIIEICGDANKEAESIRKNILNKKILLYKAFKKHFKKQGVKGKKLIVAAAETLNRKKELQEIDNLLTNE